MLLTYCRFLQRLVKENGRFRFRTDMIFMSIRNEWLTTKGIRSPIDMKVMDEEQRNMSNV